MSRVEALSNHRNFSADWIPVIVPIQTLAVAGYLNFRHAANALGVAQSSVSARVNCAGGRSGALLFERNTQGVRLTGAGRFFERVLVGDDQLDYAVKTAGMATSGEVAWPSHARSVPRSAAKAPKDRA